MYYNERSFVSRQSSTLYFHRPRMNLVRAIFFLKVRQELLEEYEQVKSIVSTLESFKIDRPPDFPVSCQDEPFRDPAVWPPPVPAEHR